MVVHRVMVVVVLDITSCMHARWLAGAAKPNSATPTHAMAGVATFTDSTADVATPTDAMAGMATPTDAMAGVATPIWWRPRHGGSMQGCSAAAAAA